MGSRFVRPDQRTLTISGGDTLTVRARLTNGEQRAQFARMYIAGIDGRLKVNPLQSGMALVTSYLLDWSLTDADGKRVPIADLSIDQLTATLDQLTPEAFVEIVAAVEAHEATMQLEREAEKKTQPGGPVSSATLSSPADAAGATNGSGT